MKYKFFVYTLFPLLFVFNLLFTRQSLAKPASIFQPVIEEIEARLSSGLKMRLPAFVPTFDRDSTLYPFLSSDDSKLVMNLDELKLEFFTVLIGDTPDCSEQKNPQDCLIAAVGVTEDPIKSKAQLNNLLADNESDITQVKFSQEIEGYYFVNKLQFIIWRQDDMAYLLMSKMPKKCGSDCISKQQLIDMAKSASQEPAITSQDTSYYLF